MPSQGRPPASLGDRLRAVPPATALAISLAIVAIAAIAFVVTDSGSTPAPRTSAPASAAATPSPSPSPSASASPGADRTGVYVVMFNNSKDPSLGRTTAAKAEGIGWDVVGIGDWHGLVDANTVYYPPKLQAQAELLAADLGITRTKPAFAPMQLDRLSVIMVGSAQ